MRPLDITFTRSHEGTILTLLVFTGDNIESDDINDKKGIVQNFLADKSIKSEIFILSFLVRVYFITTLTKSLKDTYSQNRKQDLFKPFNARYLSRNDTRSAHSYRFLRNILPCVLTFDQFREIG